MCFYFTFLHWNRFILLIMLHNSWIENDTVCFLFAPSLHLKMDRFYVWRMSFKKGLKKDACSCPAQLNVKTAPCGNPFITIISSSEMHRNILPETALNTFKWHKLDHRLKANAIINQINCIYCENAVWTLNAEEQLK